MKKLMSFILAAVLCFGMSTTVFAASSPSVDNSASAPYVPSDITFSAADGTIMSWITAQESGNISISGSQASIPAGSTFSAKVVSSDAIAAAVASAKGNVDFVAYEMNLTDAAGNAITTFRNGHVDVSMPIPAGLDVPEGYTVTVYYVNNGSLEKHNTVVKDKFVTFGTTHFSTFVYVSEPASAAAATPVASPKTAENNMALYAAMFAIAAFGGAVCAARKVK